MTGSQAAKGDALIVVGAGHAGAELALASRQHGWRGPIVLVGDEAGAPYQRPPLSKAYLSGAASPESLLLRPLSAYESAGVTLRDSTRVDAIDRRSKTLVLAGGASLPYARLALCTGGRARLFAVAGMPARRPTNLHYLRRREDAEAIRAELAPGRRLVVLGGGYVGLEVAASARKLGIDVTVLEAQSRVLARVTGPEISAFYERVHREAGVDVRTGVMVTGLESDDSGTVVRAVECSDGCKVPADFVVVGIGMLPNVELAREAGLPVDNGILVDEFARTSDEHIWAAGDCASHPSAIYDRRLRVESVPNALEQARTAAASICGRPGHPAGAPWFWSDQYELKLQMAGISEGYDRFVLRGSMQARSFVGYYLRGGRLIAADAVNRPAEFMAARRLVAEGARIEPELLADESVSAKELLAML